MSVHERSFAFYKDCINDLHSQVNLVLELDGDSELVKTLIIDVNRVYTEMERTILQEEVPTKFAESLGFIQSQYALKAELDANVFDGLSSKNITRNVIESILCRPLRSKDNFIKVRYKSSTKGSLKSVSSKCSTTSKNSFRINIALAFAKV